MRMPLLTMRIFRRAFVAQLHLTHAVLATYVRSMDQRIQVVIDLMEEYLYHDFSLEEMARVVNLSSSRFSHLFKNETGISFVQYLKSRRMQRAKELIATTFLSMKQIMSKVGMHDKSHFAQDFKKIYGMTPTQYRARYLSVSFLINEARANK